jgi:hypothetical protein
MNKKEWHWMPDYKNKIGVQGGDYYKPVEYKPINKNNEINNRNS